MSKQHSGQYCPACGKHTDVEWGWQVEKGPHTCPHCGATFTVDYEDSIFDGEASWPIWIATLVAHQPRPESQRNRRIGDCPCIFKGSRCRYAGPATECDKTLERCQELENVINFRGGYPQPIPGVKPEPDPPDILGTGI